MDNERELESSEASEAVEIRQPDQIDFHLLTEQLADILSQQIGGVFRVSLQRYEITRPGPLQSEMSLTFHVTDHSAMERFMR